MDELSLIKSEAAPVKILGKMSLNVVNPEAEHFYESVGITIERRDELLQLMNDMMMRLSGQRIRTCEIFSELVSMTNNLEEAMYCAISHTNYMARTGNPY